MPKKRSTRSVPVNRDPGPSGGRKRSLGLPDLLVLLLCIAGVLSCLRFFQLDLNQSLTRLNDVPVATISWKYKAAQRRFIDRVLWDRLQRDSPVYNGDMIRTADLSEATVTFRGGEVIDLAENSIIQIFSENAMPRIDFSRGGISLNAADGSGGGIILSSGGTTVEVAAGGVVNAAAESDGGFSLTVAEGSAQVSTSAGITEAAAGSAFSLDAAGAPGTESRAVPLSPRSAARYLNPSREKLPLEFVWNRVNYAPGSLTRLEIAEDRGFTRLLARADLDGDRTSLDLDAGTWWWRVYPTDGNGAENGSGNSSSNATAAIKLTVAYAPAPVLMTPAADYIYRFRTRQPAVRFQWTETGEASFYVLEVADNPQFTPEGMALQTQVRLSSLVFSQLRPGRWYWRVRPVFSAANTAGYQGNAAASETASFVIEQTAALPAPVLTGPEDGGVVNIAAGRQDAYFSWKHEGEADSYTVLISPRRDLANPLIRSRVTENFYAYPAAETLLQNGQYYWGVYQTDAEGNNSAVSAAQGFIALDGGIAQRTVYPPDNYTVAENLVSDIRFTWKTNPSLQTRFQISGSPDFSDTIVNAIAAGETFHGERLPAGLWYWRITGTAGERQVFQTEPKRLNVAAPFAPPVMETPAGGGRVIVRDRTPVEFRWQHVAGAEQYQFRLFRGENRQEPLFESTLRGSSQAVDFGSYGEGDYYWTVQALAGENPGQSRRSGFAAGAEFAAGPPALLRAVSLDYPPTGSSVPGLNAFRQPGAVRWSAEEDLGASRFILSRNPNPLQGRPLMDIANPGREIRLNRLEPGVYYWTIRAGTVGGRDISAAAPSWFRVLPPPLLPQAAGRQPEDGHIVGPAELRAIGASGSGMSFTWEAVSGANAYIFTIVPSEGAVSSELVRSGPMPQTSCTLEDLSVLDLGDFVWQVEALFIAEDGTVLQRGALARNRFTIDIPLPKNPAPHNPGTLYGR